MEFRNHEFINKFLAVLAVVIMVALIGLIASNAAFNQKVYSVQGDDDSYSSYMTFGNRDDSTSSWVKRDFDLNGEKVDLQAQTYDGTLHNNSSDNIVSWNLNIKIKGDCFINNAWCGVVEIHQFVGTERETVQTLDLRDYNLDEINLDYLYDGDLLIPLKRGDYLIYSPSVKDGELPVRAKEELTMGMIFYYLDSIDLTDYTIEYGYHRELTKTLGFYGVIALIIIWLIVYALHQVALISYRRVRKEMELKRSGISYMSEIYDVIYIVDLLNDELIPAGSDESSDNISIKGYDARVKYFDKLVEDVSDAYKDLVRAFVDITTLPDRLNKESIVCEYISNSKGWCQARFFSMERVEGQPLTMAVFTIQITHEEKIEMDKIEQELVRESLEKSMSMILYQELSPQINETLKRLQAYTSQLISVGKEKEIEKTKASGLNETDVRGLASGLKEADAKDPASGLKEADARGLASGLKEADAKDPASGLKEADAKDLASGLKEADARGLASGLKEADAKDLATGIYQDGKTLSALINELILALQLSAGLAEPAYDTYSFQDMVDQVLDQVKEPVSKKGLLLKTDISPRIPAQLYGDREKLSQIMTSLILKAVQSTENGDITLSIFGKEKENKLHLLISVRDNGQGYLEEDVKEFAKAYQDPEERIRNLMSGYGIEIGIIEGLLALMDSELKLVSVYGEGSDFYFEIEQGI